MEVGVTVGDVVLSIVGEGIVVTGKGVSVAMMAEVEVEGVDFNPVHPKTNSNKVKSKN